MNIPRVVPPAHDRSRELRSRRANTVLADRTQAVVAVGAWVEGGQDFQEHPAELALLTQELQAQKTIQNELSLQRFQHEVRHRVAQISKKRQQLQKADAVVKMQQQQVLAQQVSAGQKTTLVSSQKQKHISRVMQRSSQETSEGMRQVRLRLAACRMSPHGEMMSDLPGDGWNRHISESHMTRQQQEVEKEEEGEDLLFTSQHECPFIVSSNSSCHQDLLSEHELWDISRSQPDPGFKSNLKEPQVLWPLADQEEVNRQRQSHFLMQRRLFMNMEREQVKANNHHRKHLKRTARIKAEKEQIRKEDERKFERARQLADAQQKVEERELLILESLKLEEEEQMLKLERRRRLQKEIIALRFIEALRARMKERMSQEKLELPPLCYCASSFWDSHPDTCANNCVFYNNPKVYAQALYSAMLTLDFQ